MDKNKTEFIFKTHDKSGNINHIRLFKILFSSWFIFILIAIPVEIYLLDNKAFENLGIINALWSFIYL
jgi:hypothetical protein